MLHSNQSSTFWQAEFASLKPFREYGLANVLAGGPRISTASFLFFQRAGEEVYGALRGIRSVGGTIAVFIDGVFEGVPGLGVNVDLHFFAELFESLLKLFDVFDR